jgi:hypothetical protein
MEAGSEFGEWIAGFLDFVHRPVLYKLENTFRKLDFFRPQVRRGKTTILLGPLERANNINHWTSWRRKQIHFPKRCVF